ncbi:hypothetical protein AAFF_G00356670 [Aldrovandia affinis]|uniref:Transposase n=1 Tax=Aldrovandia affinis TaxID=143900 RepID=A0AAD7T8H2_9TELE|nr:hypothetical protein AAFF_G00356670 [Aldrovandia affinis]
MWNKTGRSSLAFEVVDSECKLQFIRPNKTRWNSQYMAVERITHILNEQGEEAFSNICAEFKIKMLNPAEVAFLSEYCTVMKPLVRALNILQSETNTHMGWLLPTIYQLEVKLKRMATANKVKVSLPLVQAIQQGIQKRFGEMMQDPELIATSILLPKFKTSWTDNADIIQRGLDHIKAHLHTMAEEEAEPQRVSSDDDDFFSFKPRKSQAGELDGYLACLSDKMDLLHSFPSIKKLSLKVNTGLPASAACERLFSCAGLLFTAKRARIDCVNFENQLLLKLNSKFRV